jgi:ribonuclease Z
MVQRGPAWQGDLMLLDQLSHLVTKELQGKKGEDLIIARTRAAGYNGPLLTGVDRMAFRVKVIPPRSIDDLQNLDSKGQPFP